MNQSHTISHKGCLLGPGCLLHLISVQPRQQQQQLCILHLRITIVWNCKGLWWSFNLAPIQCIRLLCYQYNCAGCHCTTATYRRVMQTLRICMLTVSRQMTGKPYSRKISVLCKIVLQRGDRVLGRSALTHPKVPYGLASCSVYALLQKQLEGE